MKPRFLNRWFKLLILLWVFAIIVMLLIPSQLSDKQLAQIQPGMKLTEVTSLLGERMKYITLERSSEGTNWVLERKWWNPSLRSKLEGDVLSTVDSSRNWSVWYAETQLLWVEHKDGVVTRTRMSHCQLKVLALG